VHNLINNIRPDAHKLTAEAVEQPKLGLVPAWSYSRLKSFEECPYKVYIASVKKIQEPQGEAAARGEAIHLQAEAFVKGDSEAIPKEFLSKFEVKIRDLRKGFVEGRVELEGEWGFTINWTPTDWMAGDCWARIKLDALEFEDESSARVIDYKTGKKIGNEISHKQQGLLYAIGTFIRYPQLQFVRTEFWYVDQNEEMVTSYTRNEALRWLPQWTRRGMLLTTNENWRPTPSPNSCRWCHYGKGEHPECTHAAT